DLDALTNAVVQGLRKHVETEEPVEEGSFGTGDTDILSDLSQTADDAAAEGDEDDDLDGEFEDEPLAEDDGDGAAGPASPAPEEGKPGPGHSNRRDRREGATRQRGGVGGALGAGAVAAQRRGSDHPR